ncbi:HD-GYP domain-containing protein [Streptomyces sp. CA-250714]|uniref:HD-GYP domain-containing protein n=1 Tax=Streptomyces sp. CA-250714 TaxID=3240060 RepID=UPI003D925A58
MTRRTAARLVAAAYGVAALVAGSALGVTLWRGVTRPDVALAFGLVVAVGELARVRLTEDGVGVRTTGLLSGAGALGYALCGQVGGTPAGPGAAQAVAVALFGSLVGLAPQVALGQAPPPQAPARLALGVGFAAVCCQPLYGEGWLGRAVQPGGVFTLCLLGLALLVGCLDALLAAATNALAAVPKTEAGYGRAVRQELSVRLGTVPALAATAVLLALAVAVAGLWALLLCCAPLLVIQFALRRRASVRATHRRTLASLARAPEVAGCTPHGHARRVAELSRAVGRELGLTGGELTALEYAALTHDVGQLSLAEPVPGGATTALEPGRQRRIALLGGAVLRQAGARWRVASAVEAQADPYREQSVTARVVRTVNAYEDLVTGSHTKGRTTGEEAREWALRQLRTATGRDHEPRVVEALSRVVARAGEGRGAGCGRLTHG